jgi:beta-lactamase regulating signal transducer with metallopeptidase domain
MNAFPLLSDDPGTWFAVDVAAKGTLLIVLGAGLVLLFNRSSAALRHRVWALVFVALLLLPVLHFAVPGWHLPVIPRTWQRATPTVQQAPPIAIPASSRPAALGTTTPTALASAASGTPSVQETRAAGPGPSASVGDEQVADDLGRLAGRQQTDRISHVAAVRLSGFWLVLAWLSGALLAAVPLAIGILANTRTRRRCPRLTDPDWQALLARLSDRLGLRREVTLLVADAEQMPMTFGRWRPCVVLPADARRWSPERRQVVLLHELAHVTRHDVPLQMIGRLACAVYWFHPLAWWALRRMRVEREYACDDHVLRTGQKAADYAAELLEIARAHGRRSVLLNAALSMARPSQLEGRLLAVLDANRRRTPLSRPWTSGLAALTFVLALSLGIVHPALEAESREPLGTGSVSASERGGDPTSKMVITGVVLSPNGKTVAGADVELIAANPDNGWPQRVISGENVERHRTKAGAEGKFRFVLSRNVSRPRYLNLYASADGYALAMENVDTLRRHIHVELKLRDTKVVRLKLIDIAGRPVSGVEPILQYALVEKGKAVWGGYGLDYVNIPRWPRCGPSDKEGDVSFVVPSSAEELNLAIDDAGFGAQLLKAKVSDQPAVVALKQPRILEGKVQDAKTGRPIAGAEVVLMFQRPERRVRTGPDGKYRIVFVGTAEGVGHRESTIQVYPPPETDYLFYATEWEPSPDGFSKTELAVPLQRGVVVEGHVLEKGNGRPVVGAAIAFQSQRKGNPYFRQSGRARLVDSEMEYVSNAQGKFRMAVCPGPGYLLVTAPTLDYVHQQITWGEIHYGKAGLERDYYDVVLRLDLKPDDHPPSLKIELERGRTLRCKVVRPDGQPANANGFARSYLRYKHKHDVRNSLPQFLIEDGILELPGFEAKHTNPLFLFDAEHHCGAMVALNDVAADGTGPTIQLQPCGSAKFRFVNEKGRPLSNYRPMPCIVVTPGEAFTGHIEANRPLWADSVIWQNIAWPWPAQPPRADADGRLTINNLIPGATYRLSYPGKAGDWDDGYEFTARSGETVDVGKVVIPEHN